MQKILCVDDDSFVRKMLSFNFENVGIENVMCSNGFDALEKLEQDSYDLAILDIMMPQMDGFTLYEEMRTKNISTPVIFLTAKVAEHSLIQGLELGAEDYITKPFRLNELNIKVKRILERQALATKH